MSKLKIKKCPWCGSKHILIGFNTTYSQCECADCHAKGPKVEDGNAITEWNKAMRTKKKIIYHPDFVYFGYGFD